MPDLEPAPGGLAAAPAEPQLSVADVIAPEGLDVIPSAVEQLQVKLGTSEQTVKMRARAGALLALAQAGKSRAEIAKALGMKPNAVKVALWRLRSAGLLNDLRDKLQHDVAANAVDCVNRAIVKDRNVDVAMEALKGVGFWKNHSHSKHEGGPGGFQMPPLQVNVIFGNGAQPLPGQAPDFSEAVVGTPREDA